MEEEGIASNTYIQLVQLVWAENCACTLYWNIPSVLVRFYAQLDQLYVFGAIPSSSIQLYTTFSSMVRIVGERGTS